MLRFMFLFPGNYGCTRTSPLRNYTGGPAIVNLTETGPQYYISGTVGHCSRRQKLAINVSPILGYSPISQFPIPSASTLSANQSAAGTSYTVGGSTGWIVPSGNKLYDNWVANITFIVGDSLVFNFNTSCHDVLRVTRANYNSCTTTGSLESYINGPASVNLAESGPHYYICGLTGHCSCGQKLAITVSKASEPSPLSAPEVSPLSAPEASPLSPLPFSFLTPSPSIPSAAATSFTVGGSTGWIIPTSNKLYDNWAANITFKVGDSLLFNFATNVHNVLEVTRANYNSFFAAGSLESYTIGPATVNLTEPGAHYYICGVAGHCSAGQKIKITVSGKFLNLNRQKKWMPSIEAAVGVASGVFVISFIIFIYIRINRKKRDLQEEEDIRGYMDPLDSRHPSVENFLHAGIPTRYSYHQIKRYTNNFATRLGQGAFGTVFKGELPNGCMIAVKILDKSKHCKIQFMNEVATIGRIHHLHLVRLLGYCFEGSKRALVYEYMVNGSLEKYIHGDDQNVLNWKQLHFIAMGTARGLAYLHDDCRNKILHCDIKPHNVLLDANFSPKVADFGLAKLTDREESHVSLTGPRGTPGYVAPEVWSRRNGPVTDRSDVYSYGMLVMEMVGGRKNFDMKATRSSKFYYPEWAFEQVEMGEFRKLREENIVDDEDETIAKQLSMLGLWCIQYNALQRPSMSRVIQMLEGTVDIAMPPQPFPVNTLIETEASTESSSLE